MMRVIDGAKVLDGTNNASDIPQANYAAANTMNSTSVDMRDPGHRELLANVRSGVLLGTATLAVTVQESDEAAANFTNVAGAQLNFAATDDNKSKWCSVDWNHPDRKRYGRLQGITANNTVEWGAVTLRVGPSQQVTTDTNVIKV